MKKISIPVRQTKHSRAFSRLELLAVLAALALLISVVIPVLAAADPKAQGEACRNNLKQIGVAFRMYADLHLERMPWRVSKEDGGSYNLPIAGNAWAQFLYLSNQLESPQFLACPSDRIKPAKEWGRDPDKGYLNPRFRGNAVSYFVGLDVRPEAPDSLLSGDGNIQPSATGQACDYAKVNNASSLLGNDKELKWIPGRHAMAGNILFHDGRVEELSSGDLRKALDKSNAFHKENHTLLPR